MVGYVHENSILHEVQPYMVSANRQTADSLPEMHKSLLEQAAPRFWKKAQKTDTCWLWIAGVSSNGYGSFCLNGRTMAAHRIAWELLRGAIPDGLTIDHLCRNRICVNPTHMELVTSKENTLRGFNPTAINARKTKCLRGHSLSGENLYMHCGGRACRTCRREQDREWKREWRRVRRLQRGH